MENEVKICQSCGMPLDEDPQGGGTNAGGTKTDKYCSYCYEDGKFTDGGMSLPEYTEKMIEIAVTHMNLPESEARAMAESMLPNLERWKV